MIHWTPILGIWTEPTGLVTNSLLITVCNHIRSRFGDTLLCYCSGSEMCIKFFLKACHFCFLIRILGFGMAPLCCYLITLFLGREEGKDFPFSLNNYSHFCIKRVETWFLPHPLKAKSRWLRFTKVVDFDFGLPYSVFPLLSCYLAQ